MKKQEFSDNEIQILGQKYGNLNNKKRKGWKFALVVAVVLIAIVLITKTIYTLVENHRNAQTQSLSVQLAPQPQRETPSETPAVRAFVELSEETVNDVPLRIYTPRNAAASLTLTEPDEADTNIVFVAPAADAGGNNYGIVGDFVLAGERLARGISKKGFCAIINQTVTVGVGDDTPLLDEAIREKGYFFRQYPIVKNSEPVFNRPKGKSIRRAIAIREGSILIVESRERESFYDFAQALSDAGVSEAVYLQGGVSYGWWRDERGVQGFFGTKKEKHLEGANYLIFTNKQI